MVYVDEFARKLQKIADLHSEPRAAPEAVNFVKRHATFDNLFIAADRMLPEDKRLKFVPHSGSEMVKTGERLINKGLYPFTTLAPIFAEMVKRYGDRPEGAIRVAAAKTKMSQDFQDANNSLPEQERFTQTPATPKTRAAVRLAEKFLAADRVNIFQTNMAMAAALEFAKKGNPAVGHRHAAALQVAKRRAANKRASEIGINAA